MLLIQKSSNNNILKLLTKLFNMLTQVDIHYATKLALKNQTTLNL